MKEGLRNSAGKAYENYIMRDLSFVVSGFILIFNSLYAFNEDPAKAFNNFKNIIDYFTEDILKFILLLTVSYFIGLIGLQISREFKKGNHELIKIPQRSYREHEDALAIMPEIYQKYGSIPIRDLERFTYLKFVGAAFGAAFCISSLILLIPLVSHRQSMDFIIFSAVVFMSYVCIKMNRRFWNRHDSLLKSYANKLIK